MQTVTNPLPKRSTANNSSYPASVPLSVYRQLANELQAAQGKINQLNAANQQLSQENQLLRQEISKVVESVGNLENLLSSPQEDNLSPQVAVNILRQNQKVVKTRTAAKSQRESPSSSNRSSTVPPASRNWQPQPIPNYPPISETFYIEEQEVRYDRHHQLDAAQLSGWRLVIGIFLIILTAFGAGYLVVRPLLEIRSR
jgi:cobalamin biosynthesis Mg chelatase CobN